MLQITAALANVYIISDKSLVDKIFVNNTFLCCFKHHRCLEICGLAFFSYINVHICGISDLTNKLRLSL